MRDGGSEWRKISDIDVREGESEEKGKESGAKKCRRRDESQSPPLNV